MEIFHESDGGNVFADVTEATQFLAYLDVSQQGLIVRKLALNHRSRKIPLNLVCKGCGLNFDLENEDDRNSLLARCYGCGESNKFTDLVIPRDSGGLFCEKCSERYRRDGERLINLMDLILSNSNITF